MYYIYLFLRYTKRKIVVFSSFEKQSDELLKGERLLIVVALFHGVIQSLPTSEEILSLDPLNNNSIISHEFHHILDFNLFEKMIH